MPSIVRNSLSNIFNGTRRIVPILALIEVNTQTNTNSSLFGIQYYPKISTVHCTHFAQIDSRGLKSISTNQTV